MRKGSQRISGGERREQERKEWEDESSEETREGKKRRTDGRMRGKRVDDEGEKS